MITSITNIHFKNIPTVIFKGDAKKEDISKPSLETDFFVSQNKISTEDKLLQLEDIHCPNCGKLMMSKEKFSQLLQQAENIKTPEGYCNLLKANKSYLSDDISVIFDYSQKILKENPNIEITDFLRKMRESGQEDIITTIDEVGDLLQQDLEDSVFMEEDSKKVANFIRALNALKRDNSKEISYKELRGLLDSKLNHPERFNDSKLFNSIREKFRKSIVYRNAVNNTGLSWHSNHQNCRKAVYRLFNTSVSQLTNVTDSEIVNEDKYNKILLCEGCNHSRSERENYFMPILGSEKLSRNLGIYLDDLVQVVGREELPEEPNYINKLATVVDFSSKGRVHIPKNELIDRLEQARFLKDRPDFPILDLNEDVPCVCCGTPMLNYKRKHEIVDEKIQNAENPVEINQLIKEYRKYINPEFYDYINLIDDLIRDNKGISSEDVIEEVQILAAKKLKSKMDLIIKEIRNVETFDFVSSEEKEKLNTLADDLETEYPASAFMMYFDFSKYHDLLYKTSICRFDDPYGLKGFVLSDFKNDVTIHNRAFPSEGSLLRFNDDELKAFAKEIFKMSGMTVDHFIARSRLGDSRSSNLLAMCKMCNSDKSNESPRTWVNRKPNLEKNLKKNLLMVEELLAQGKLPKSFERYPRGVANNFYRATGGQVDVRLSFRKSYSKSPNQKRRN